MEDRTLLSAVVPASVVVTNTSDSVNGDTSSISALETDEGGDGISLREAIEAANNTSGADTITFDPGLAGKTVTLGGTQLELSDDVTINNSGAKSVTIDANQQSRVFRIDSGVTAEISGVTITGGSEPNNEGGGIYNSGTLTLENSTLSGNSAKVGGAIGADSSVTVANSTFSNNSALVSGGAIFALFNDVSSSLAVTNSTFTANRTTQHPADYGGFVGGGGIFCTGSGALTVSGSTFRDNTAGVDGGGILLLSDAPSTVMNCTFTGNTAGIYGGGIFYEGVVGPISLTVTNSTLVANQADSNGNGTGDGGGITRVNGDGTLTLNNSIVAGNVKGTAGSASEVSGAVGGSYNLIGDPTSPNFMNGVNGNIVGDGAGGPLDLTTVFVDANNDGKIDSADLADNGGPTMTLALKAGGPAVDAGDNTLAVDAGGNPLANDQRGAGFARVANGTVDMGAYEVQAVSPLVVTNTNDSGPGSLRAAIDYANSHPGPDAILFNIPTTDPNFIDVDSALTGGDAAPDVFVIKPLSALPALAGGDTTIDGRTQTTFTGETNPFGPEIVLDGGSLGSGINGLTITSDGNLVEGLNVRNFSGSGVRIIGGSGNRVSSCYLGTDALGTSTMGNSAGVLILSGATYNIVGTNGDGVDDANEGNLISGNFTNVGITQAATNHNTVAGNLIGSDRTGTLALSDPSDNVAITVGASFNIIGTNGDGTSDALERNVIVGARWAGIAIYNDNADGNVVAGNYVGVDVTGAKALPNTWGVIFGYEYGGIGSHNARIGTNSDGISDNLERNVISGNGQAIVMSISSHTLVAGNYIGTDATGEAAIPNGNGISISGQNNTIGGSVASARNIISGNTTGVTINGAATKNLVAGNYIGTNKEGTAALANTSHGVVIQAGASGNTIGGSAGFRNLISANGSDGVAITGSGTSNNTVAGNVIGTTADGGTALGNGGDGVLINGGASGNVIGTNGDGAGDAAERNVISGNVGQGVHIAGSGSDNNIVAGNYIGTNADGTGALGNGQNGVYLNSGAQSNRIGTDGDGTSDDLERNLISGNMSNGILIAYGATNFNVVAGNFIGTDVTGKAALGNTGLGVYLYSGPSQNIIGTNGDGHGDAAERNVIAGNASQGVGLGASNQNIVAGNNIGTDVTGTKALGNNFGVVINNGATANTVGGTTAETRNIISGNAGGIRIGEYGINTNNSGDSNVIEGNYIGTDVTGSQPLGNGSVGVLIQGGGLDNRVGTDGDGADDAAERNVISGNGAPGVLISGGGTDMNVVAGNYIGTDVTGSSAIGNGQFGVAINAGARFNLIGTDGDGVADDAERNVISGNLTYTGVEIDGAGTDSNVVAGNYIGTNAAGTAAIPNATHGVTIQRGARFNRVGTNGDGVGDAADRNLISGNTLNGIEIWGNGTDQNIVAGNYIGTNAAGNAVLPNERNGVVIYSGASLNRVGTDGDGQGDAAEGNLISGNALDGVVITGAGTDDNVVAGNFIGTDAGGTVAVPNGLAGIHVQGGAGGNTIGTDGDGQGDVNERNVIAGNANRGVYLQGNATTGNVVAGNYIGVDATGEAPLGNGLNDAVSINYASGNVIGGTAPGTGNVLSGGSDSGVYIYAGSNNQILGNHIGTDAGGTKALGFGNAHNGVTINSGSNNVVGGADPRTRNIISGNLGDGILIVAPDAPATGNVVEGNYIGTDVSGLSALANGIHGVVIQAGAQSNLIGTNGDGIADAAERNVISGNHNFGVLITDLGTDHNVVAGNYIGTNSAGDDAVPNGNHGVVVAKSAGGNRIGTDGSDDPFNADERNVISGNMYFGVSLDIGATANVVAGNYIGTDATGTTILSNGWQGVSISHGSHDNRIGTDGDGIADAAERNVISGNVLGGVFIGNNGSDHNLVAGNFIGTDVNGLSNLGNGAYGVEVADGARANTVGGAGILGNTIAFNTGAGVAVLDTNTTGNAVRGNAIFSNGGLGIDLGEGGVTPNDTGDADTGPNNLQNFPAILAAQPGSSTRVVGSLDSAPGTAYVLDFYASSEADPSGHGEGGRYLGWQAVSTDANGHADFTALVGASSPGEFITATVTDSDGNTSEFSSAQAVDDTPPTVQDVIDLAPDPRNTVVDSVDVVFSEPIVMSTISTANVSLQLNGASTPIVGPLSFLPLAPDRVRISGLGSSTGADGTYQITVNPISISDIAGNFGVAGSASDSWLMDTVAPISQAASLAPSQTSYTFPVRVNGNDPAPSAGVAASGLQSYSLYVSTDAAPFVFWKTIPATTPTADFTGQAGHHYYFRSVATDSAGNVETKPVTIEAGTFVPDLSPPVTSYVAGSMVVNDSTGLITFNVTGTDAGGSGLSTFSISLQIDNGAVRTIATVSAGLPDVNGNYSASTSYQSSLIDGASHTYRFFVAGIDGVHNTEAAHATPDLTLTHSFSSAPLAVSQLVVQNGQRQRSFIQVVDIQFNQTGTDLADLVANRRVRLVQHPLTGPDTSLDRTIDLWSPSAHPADWSVQAVDHAIELNFGQYGLGGTARQSGQSLLDYWNAQIQGDGYYELDLDLDGSGNFATHEFFYRMLGDADGSQSVNATDVGIVRAAQGQLGFALPADVNGDGRVDVVDLVLVSLSSNKKQALKTGLHLDG